MSVSSKSNITIIVQARMGSTRLPGKSMKAILGKPMLSFLLERLSHVRLADSLVVATSELDQDQPIADFCAKNNIRCSRGSENDVLARFKKAADESKATAIVRVSGDCPLMDPTIVDAVIQRYKDLSPDIDYVSNTLERTFPRGMDVEIFSKSALDTCFTDAKNWEEREHVTPYIYRNPKLFRIENLRAKEDHSDLRLTVDTSQDFQLISLLLETLYPKNPQFSLEDILKQLHKHPEWISINADIKQKKIDQR